MAVAEIFSIREFAWKMRGVDYEKCWPFLEDRKGRSLPPMPIRKFQWWADELREVRSVVAAAGGLDLRKVSVDAAAVQVQLNISAETSGVDLERDREASAEERQERTRPPSSRAKQRTPKKRSIIELFAVAPPIRITHEEDRQDHRRGGGKKQGAAVASHSSLRVGEGIEIRERKKRNKDGSCRKMLMDKIGAKKKLKPKTKVMKKHKQDEIRAAKKEETCKLYMPSPADVYKILRSKVHEKQVIKMHKKLVHKQVKTATMRTLLKKHIFRLVQTSKFVPRNQGVTRIPPGITRVKKRKWSNSTKKRKKRVKPLDSDLVELYHDPTENLTISGKGDTLLNARGSLPLQLPHLGTLCKIVSDVLTASSSTDSLSKYPSASEGAQLNTIDEETQIILNGKELITNSIPPSETSSETQFNGCFAHAAANSSIAKRTPMIEILDLNHPVDENVDLNCICQDGFMSTPSSNCSVDMNNLGLVNNSRLDPETGVCQEQSLSISADHTNRSKDPIGKGISVSNACSNLTLLWNQDSLSCLGQSHLNPIVGKTHPMHQVIDACNDFPKFHQTYQLAKDTLTSTHSSVYTKTFVEPTSIGGPIRRDKFNEGFIGLPLNSQGEFIQFHPRTRYDSCEMDKVSKSQLSSLQFFPSTSHCLPHSSYVWTRGKFPFISSNHDVDQNWFLKQYNSLGQAVLSDLGSVELQALEKLKNQTYDEKAQFNHCDPGQLEFSHPTCRDHIITESCSDSIEFRSDRAFELGMQSVIQPTMRLMGKNVTVGSYNKEYHATNCHNLRMYKPVSKRSPHDDCIVQTESGSLEIPSNYCSISPEKCTPNCMHLGFGYEWTLNGGCSSTSGDCGFHFDLSRSLVPSQSFMNRHSTVHGRVETQSVDVEKRKMFWSPYPPNIRHHMLVNSNNCEHGQSLSYSVPSTSHPTFPSQVSTQASRATPIQKLPQWMQDSTSSHHFIRYPTSMYHSCNMQANSGYPHASMHPRPVVSFPSSSNRSSHTYESYAPIMFDPSSITGSATKNYSFTSSNYGDKIKVNYGGGFIFVHNNSQDHSNKGRKRFASADEKDMETAKRPNLKLQKDLNFTASVSREQPVGQKDNAVASEVNACVSSAVDVSCPVTDNEKDNVVASGGFVCSKSSHKRSGPVKLSAGAKHILRPNGSLDQNSPPIYSTVYFTQATSSSKDEKEKAEKVYRL
ncbi:uncharacterized protein LOC122000762 [Zingiber officinale]|uniref:Uncharacterized protein n=1 Tax=Zingiber officinale TaxID=94328 RepID=A0A8J5G508_ZINOF|nr:uncharacterized protein LOC122000762 [Zingiber officinale]KAG6491680.1 hypothetical protein ZIOFF_046616 [Zingiber officinale]